MCEITIHTGLQSDQTRINIDWFDENGVHHKDVLDVNVLSQDKPRTLHVNLNGRNMAEISPGGVMTKGVVNWFPREERIGKEIDDEGEKEA